MRLLIDRHSMQALTHFDDGARLSTLLDLVERELGCEAFFSEQGTLSATELSTVDVLIVPTRSVWLARWCADRDDLSFTTDELQSIIEFVRDGGGLFMLSNHAEINAKVPDHTDQDRRLAVALGLDLDATAFLDRNGAVTITEGDLNRSHPIISGESRCVSEIVTNNFTTFPESVGIPLVRVPSHMKDHSTAGGVDPQGRLFAAAVTADNSRAVGAGRVVLCGDSGFLGSPGTSFPGPGLFDRGDNATFVTNAIEWLAHR